MRTQMVWSQSLCSNPLSYSRHKHAFIYTHTPDKDPHKHTHTLILDGTHPTLLADILPSPDRLRSPLLSSVSPAVPHLPTLCPPADPRPSHSSDTTCLIASYPKLTTTATPSPQTCPSSLTEVLPTGTPKPTSLSSIPILSLASPSNLSNGLHPPQVPFSCSLWVQF